MSNFVIYLDLPVHLSQWLTHSLGCPVRFPSKSAENAVITRFIQRLPAGAHPDVAADGLTPVCIPDSKAKDPAYYNYMGPYGKEALVQSIRELFRISLWNELGRVLVEDTNGVNAQVYAWCEMHGIDIDHMEPVRQMFFRMRRAYTKSGIILIKNTKKRGDDNG